MGEEAIKELSRLIRAAHKAQGREYLLALIAIGRAIMKQTETEPLVIHNTDAWKDEKIEVEL